MIMVANDEKQRPDPDVLLAQVQTQEKRAARGKLRIYFGASAGVGKTYAMLEAANKLNVEEYQILVGVVATHGRSETERLLHGLEVLPPKIINYHGKDIKEFDIDEALKRQPQLILVDELAHVNVEGTRHPKRWQDVEELLSAGVDVFTTLNVQHLESLNDVIGGITGIRVGETIPDTIFDQADEVVLVDIPVDELLARLKAGKVYHEHLVEQAVHNFFRKGNLIALRELALRRTAERVGEDVQAYRVEQSINAVWKTDSLLLACVGPYAGGEHVVRSTARLAGQLNADWHAIYVETPELQRLLPQQRERIFKTLKLAEDLGATTTVLSGNDSAQAIVNYARKQNFSKIILGRSRPNWFWRKSHLQRIAFYAPDFDLLEIGYSGKRKSADKKKLYKTPAFSLHRQRRYWRYLWAAVASLLTALVILPFFPFINLANVAMLFLLVILLVAISLGRGPSVVATLVGIAAFDYFFVPPRYSFAVVNFEYVIMFVVMLTVGLLTGYLTANLRFQARIASYRETRARALYELARNLSSALQAEQIFTISHASILRAFNAKATLLLPDDTGHLQLPITEREKSSTRANVEKLDLGIAQWAFEHSRPAGIGTDTLPASRFFYLPLVGPMRTRGLLVIEPENRHWILIPEQRQQLDTFAALIALTLERVHYIRVAQDALVHMESDRLRNSLLASLSHDLRAPLASLLSLSKSLVKSCSSLIPLQQKLAKALREETLKLWGLISNLFDMGRIQSGELKLNLQWQAIAEVVANALKASSEKITKHQVETKIAHNVPLVYLDAVLIERVLCDLLENAAKYTPPGTQIVLAVEASDGFISINVYDNGPGFPPGKEEIIFEKFTRGVHASTKPGVGLGLAICRAIIEAHGGTIRAGHSPVGGASIIFTLPVRRDRGNS
jgi:two-component system, OmpR family, sensor histidine kinase KdpD